MLAAGRAFRLVSPFFFLLLLVGPVSGSPLMVVGIDDTCFWHPYVDDQENNALPGEPYWDGNSWDTQSNVDEPGHPHNPANIGALLEGHIAVMALETFSLDADAPGPLEFWTHADHSAADGFWFQDLDGPSYYVVTLLGEISGRRDLNEFGWFAPSDPAALHPIFSPLDARGATWAGTLPAEFGFYLRDEIYGEILTTTAESLQFALFAIDARYYLGIEDLTGPMSATPGVGLSDYDYNDMILRLDHQPVPEPASLLLLGTGLLGWAFVARRFRKPRR
jgi:hypothetical protein